MADQAAEKVSVEKTMEQLRNELKQKDEIIKKYSTNLASLNRQYSCTVCDNLMFQPCVISCGHTFCYSCLLEWFKRKKTCPSCRLRVATRPAISLEIKSTVQMLIDNCELFENSESKELLETKQTDELQLVTEHKKRNGHIFPFMFADISENADYEDGEDGVRRCAICHWEVEGTRCLRCYDWGDSYDESDEAIHDSDLDSYDGSDDFIDLEVYRRMQRTFLL
ncbi:hypothetical protein V1512DRAFT_264162 [Lipomyces arxii]|uniref:uncharacterized protein n=1 Tax=Lipomyces arxii TaxID=56418 RepID=UPI0034CEDB85